MALGASMGRVQRDFIFNTLRLATIGILVGTTAAIASARLIASLLFATSPWDITTYAGMVLQSLPWPWFPATCPHEKLPASIHWLLFALSKDLSAVTGKCAHRRVLCHFGERKSVYED